MAEYLEPRPANLASQTTQAKSDGELKDLILKGKEGTAMAGFEGAFEEPQLNDLLVVIFHSVVYMFQGNGASIYWDKGSAD